MNPFESGERKAIPAVLIYARAKADGKWLLVHRSPEGRVAETHDRGAEKRAGASRPEASYHAGKWNGLGGKLELDESSLECARREFHEEAGVDLPAERFRALGFLQFPNFKAHKGEDWLVTVFTVDLDERETRAVPAMNDEGELHWKAPSEFERLSFWPGDRHFLPYVLERRSFIGAIWYRGPEVVRHWVQGLGVS